MATKIHGHEYLSPIRNVTRRINREIVSMRQTAQNPQPYRRSALPTTPIMFVNLAWLASRRPGTLIDARRRHPADLVHDIGGTQEWPRSSAFTLAFPTRFVAHWFAFLGIASVVCKTKFRCEKPTAPGHRQEAVGFTLSLETARDQSVTRPLL